MFDIIGKILTIVLASYGIFVFLGKKWIENKFSKNLEEFKNNHQKELEDLKFKINSQFNRITKIHEKEIEILPEAWSKLHDAYSITYNLVCPFQSYPDLNKIREEELKEFVEKCPLKGYQKKELLESEDKTDYYIKNIFYHRLYEAKVNFNTFNNYIVKNRIFLSKEIKELFMKANDIIRKALHDKESSELYENYSEVYKSYEMMKDELGEIIKKIESCVQDRLDLNNA